MAETTFSSIQNDAISYYIADRTIQLSKRRLVLGGLAQQAKLPQRMGKTMRVIRHKRLDLPFQPLTEGVTPASVGISIEEVDIPVEQWGIVVSMSDVSLITTKHPILEAAIRLKGLAMSEMMERETAESLMGGTNVVFAGVGNSARSDLAATDIVTSHVALEAVNALRDHGAPEYESTGLYAGVLPVQIENDIVDQDETFIGAAQFGDQKALEYAMIGRWMGVNWKRSNFLPVFKGVVAPTAAAATAEKAQFADVSGTDGTIFTTANGWRLQVVAREKSTDYERKLSQPSVVIQDSNDSFAVTMPTSTNYVYDLYITKTDGTALLLASRVAASAVVTVNAALVAGGVSVAAPVPPANGVFTFNSFVIGQDAYVNVELSGMSLQSYLTPATASDSDPLAQRRKCGSKVMFKVAILDNNFMVRIESGSGFKAAMPL